MSWRAEGTPTRWRARSALPWIGLAHAFLLEAIARDALGDEGAAGRALEQALDLVEPDGALSLFLLHPAPGLLERHARHGTAHAALIAEVLSLLVGRGPQPPSAGPQPLSEPLSDSEIRVLRYLPTNLARPDISRELCVSLNTVSTHMCNLYAKLCVHSRREAVDRARALGLLALSARGLGRAALAYSAVTDPDRTPGAARANHRDPVTTFHLPGGEPEVVRSVHGRQGTCPEIAGSYRD